MPENTDLLLCNFCGKSQKDVNKLIAGPGVYICNECVELCVEIIIEEGKLLHVADFKVCRRPEGDLPADIFGRALRGGPVLPPD